MNKTKKEIMQFATCCADFVYCNPMPAMHFSCFSFVSDFVNTSASILSVRA